MYTTQSADLQRRIYNIHITIALKKVVLKEKISSEILTIKDLI